MIKHSMPLAVLVLFAGSFALAQQIEIPDWESSVRFELVASQEPVRPGDTLELVVLVEIEPGYHLYGPEEKKPNRTEVSVSGELIKPGEPIFPPVVTRDLSGLGTYDLYEGKIAIRIPLAVEKSAAEGKPVRVDVKINYQVCTDVACSAPTDKTLSLKLPVAAKGAAVEKRHRGILDSKE